MYPEYKANRKPMPEELAEQLPRLKELLAAWASIGSAVVTAVAAIDITNPGGRSRRGAS